MGQPSFPHEEVEDVGAGEHPDRARALADEHGGRGAGEHPHRGVDGVADVDHRQWLVHDVGDAALEHPGVLVGAIEQPPLPDAAEHVVARAENLPLHDRQLADPVGVEDADGLAHRLVRVDVDDGRQVAALGAQHRDSFAPVPERSRKPFAAIHSSL
jgi:hypothetical protein